MKYVSIDIETTGLDRINDQVLEVGAIIEDTEKQLSFDEIPKFSAILKHNRITGSPYALNLNSRIIEILSNIPNKDDDSYLDYIKNNHIINPHDLGLALYTFLSSNGFEDNSRNRIEIITAGKNFQSFDKPFLQNIPNFNSFITFNRRVIDPTTLYIDFKNDNNLPSLNKCLERANINTSVQHSGVSDAWDVIQILRKKY